MATRRQPLAFGWLLPGLTAAIVLVVVALAAFLALWFSAPETSWNALIRDSYLWHVVRFSFWQAFLSALFRCYRRYSSPAPCTGGASPAARCCCAFAR
jgi:thiamine transport system permease protein